MVLAACLEILGRCWRLQLRLRSCGLRWGQLSLCALRPAWRHLACDNLDWQRHLAPLSGSVLCALRSALSLALRPALAALLADLSLRVTDAFLVEARAQLARPNVCFKGNPHKKNTISKQKKTIGADCYGTYCCDMAQIAVIPHRRL
jgi:hypothetical protein